jgi:hypothetical protein
MNFLQVGRVITLFKKVPWLNKHKLVLSVSVIAILLFVLMIVFPSVYIFFDTVLALLVAGTYLYVYLKDRRLTSHGIRAIGMVVDKEEEHGANSSADPWDAYYVTYTFTPPKKGQSLKARQEIAESLYKKLSVGCPINIAFDPEQPEKSIPVGGIQPMWFRITNSIVIAAVTFVGVALLVSIIIGNLHW